MPVVQCCNFPLFKGNLKEYKYQACNKFVVNTISPNSYGLSKKDVIVKESLQKSDILILDGVYFGLLPLIKCNIKINRITGWDAFIHYSQELNKEKGRVFFLGSTIETLKKIEQKYKNDFPNVEIGYYSPPFKPSFSKDENEKIICAINEFKPNVVFVGMTAPKQEIWASSNAQSLDINLICSIGNVFDWYAGNSKRPNVFWQKIGLEWLVRIFYRKEIFKRNIGNQMIFFKDLLLDITKIKKIC